MSEPSNMATGWRCPACRGGVRADVRRCPCAGPRPLAPAAVIAQAWHVDAETIRRMIRTGKLPSKLVGKRRLVDLDALEETLDAPDED